MDSTAGFRFGADMDPTLSQILTALYQAHATIDQLQQEIADLKERVRLLDEQRMQEIQG